MSTDRQQLKEQYGGRTSSKTPSAASRISGTSPRYNKLEANFLSGVAPATALAFWL